MKAARRFVGFALMPALSAIASLVLLPLISDTAGPPAWVALGVGQSVGALISIPVGMAWPLIGGNEVARAGAESRRNIYRVSVHSRLVMLVVSLLIAVPATFFLSPQFKLESVLFMLGIALNGLTASWYFAGTGEPRWLVINEGLVRLAVYLFSVGALMAGGGLILYAASSAIGGVVMVMLNWFRIMGTSAFSVPGSFSNLIEALRSHMAGIGSRLLQGAFTFGGAPLYSAIAAPHATALFVGLDQVAKAAGNGLAFVPQAFVQTVGSAPASERARRSTKSMLVVVAIALLAAATWAVAGNVVIEILFASQLSLTPGGNTALILAVCLTLLTRSYEVLVLVPNGRSALVFRANSYVSILGLAALTIVASIGWGYGGVLVIAMSQVVLLVLYWNSGRSSRKKTLVHQSNQEGRASV